MTRISAGCKVNLGLRITGTRPDGYHELDSLFYPLSSPCDHLEIEKTDQHGMVLECGDARIDPHKNTLAKAYGIFATATQCHFGVRVHLTKNIPLGAGLGGGSSDAAVLLSWLNGQLDHPLSLQKLSSLAVRVGADTPFFLVNMPARVGGIGEKISPVALDAKELHLLLVCPGIHIDTAWAFHEYDRLRNTAGQIEPFLTNPQAMAKYLAFHDTSQNMVEWIVANDLEDAVFPHFPILAEIRQKMFQLDAKFACMSGSGSSMVGIFQKENCVIALEAIKSMDKRFRCFCLPLDSTGM